MLSVVNRIVHAPRLHPRCARVHAIHSLCTIQFAPLCGRSAGSLVGRARPATFAQPEQQPAPRAPHTVCNLQSHTHRPPRAAQDAYYNAIGEEDTFIVDQDYVLNIGLVHAAINTFSYEFHEPAQTFVWDWICSGHAKSTPLGRALAPDSPYLGDTVMAAGLAQMYAVKMQYWDGLKKGFRQGFQCFAEQQVGAPFVGVGVRPLVGCRL